MRFSRYLPSAVVGVLVGFSASDIDGWYMWIFVTVSLICWGFALHFYQKTIRADQTEKMLDALSKLAFLSGKESVEIITTTKGDEDES